MTEAAVPAPEVHIAGLVVHAYPEAAARIADAIAAAVVDIQHIEGVLAASLVYQHCEPESAMQEEVDP